MPFLRVLGGGVLGLLLSVTLLYAGGRCYDFPPAAPFEGTQWYNPYAEVAADGGRWLRANFHAHGQAWGGLTDGHQPTADVVRAYRAMGHDVIGVSNYHAPTHDAASGVFPVYEHGWNVQKAHRLAIGARTVVWRDYPLGQTAHQRQDVLDRLRAVTPLIAIAHPTVRDGHAPRDLARLTGYDLLEVYNHFAAPAEASWDAALSAGRAVWLLASDDSHDVTARRETGVHVTRLFAAGTDEVAVIDALRAGRHYGVRAWGGVSPLDFDSLRVRGDTMLAWFGGAVARVEAVSQGGVRRAVPVADAGHGPDGRPRVVARVALHDADAYVRLAAYVAGDATPSLLLNPVVRWDGRSLPAPAATVNAARTWGWQSAAYGAHAALLLSVLGRRLRRRRGWRAPPLPVPTT